MKQLLFLLISLISVEKLQGIIVAISALQNSTSGHKIILLYDRHDLSLDQTVKEQQKELELFICALSKRKNSSSFFIEYPSLTKNFRGITNYTTIGVPIKSALENSMQLGSVVYKPFDKRTEDYFWMREMMLNFPQLQQALEQGHLMPKEYEMVSVASYLDQLRADGKEVQALVLQLPVAAQKTVSEHMKLYDQASTFIEKEMVAAKIKPSDHLQKLMEKIYSQKDILHTLNGLVTPAQVLYSDIYLLNTILTDKNSLSIVHAGLYHTYHVEKILKLLNFEDAFPEIDFKNGLDAEDINKLILPTKIPVLFAQPLRQFLGLCALCGKETDIRCSQCKKVYYCSKECQKAQWKTHKQYCKAVAETEKKKEQ